MLQVLTPWQACVSVVHAFPRGPDAIAIADLVVSATRDQTNQAALTSCSTRDVTGKSQKVVAAGASHPYIAVMCLFTYVNPVN